jgi:hypothetical protein
VSAFPKATDVNGMKPHVAGQRGDDLLGLRVVAGKQHRSCNPFYLRFGEVLGEDVVPPLDDSGFGQPLLNELTA